MSISKMDWSGRNLNGALAHPNSQQYLPVTTSSTVLNMPNHTAYVPQNSYSLAQTFLPSNQNPILIGLLGADSSEEVHQIERAVLSKPEQQTTRVSPGQYNTLYNLLHKKSTATDLNNSSNIQTVVVSNYQTQVYPNFVLHALQQGKQLPVVQQQAQQLPVVQQQAQVVECYGANGYKTKIPQSAGYTQRKTHQRMSDSYAAKRPSQRVQVSYWPTMPQPNSVNINSAQNGSSAPNVSSHKSLNINIVPVSTANYQNGQNIHNQMGSNYQAISHTSALQPQQGMNDYVQSPQRQTTSNLHSGFANNSSNVLPSATVGQAPPLYTQSNTSSSNVYNNSVNHNLSNQSQNFVAQNVQQPMQSYTLPQDQLSVAVPPPAYSENVQQVRRQHLQDILVLLKEYRDVKLKYLLLNRANNHLRQKMQSTSQDIPGSCPVRPPLISSILNTTVPADDSMGGQKVSQISTVQSRPPSNTTHIVQTPTLYDSLNVSVQNVAQPSNSPSSHAYPTNKSNVLNQTNYNSFESGQMNLGSGANSTGQVVNSDTLRVQDPRANFMVSMQINNQYHSSNSSNRNLSQDELHLTSVQTNTVASESCNPVHTTNTGNFYANTPLTSSSREAIKATLPLWKSVPQSSAQNKRGYSEPKQHGLNTQPVSAEIASRSINEPTAVTLTQKSEHSGPNVAIVSPLVKIKDMFKEINQHPKVPQGKDFANDDGVKENDCFNKSLLLLETVDAAASMKNLDVNPPISNIVSSPLCHVSSKCNVQKSAENVETVDENLQISGICTLVEGSSFYDSSVAMMFEGSLQTQLCSPLAKRDLEDHPNLQGSQDDIQTSGAFKATSSVSPATEMVAVKTDSEGDVEPCAKIQDNQQGADVCHEIQSEQTLSASDAFDLSSNNAADQLSDLLTEFPFGIKNYMSKNNLKSTGVSLEKFSKTEIPKTLVPFSYDSDGSIEDTQREDAMDTSTKETESPRIEITDQQSTLEQPRDEVLSVQFDEDGFEISDSPGDNMQITLLNQDEITKIFPEDSAEPIVDSKESVLEHLLKEPTAPLADVSVRSIKENSNDETASTSDKVLFCCLFSWLTHTNGNAPKCNCKFTEYCETEDLTSNFSQPTAVSKTEPLTAFLDPSAGVHNSTRDLKPSPDPCNTELDEMLPPAIKRPKRKPVDISSESKSDPRIVNCSPQEEIKPKPDLSFKYFKDKLQKELRKNDTLTNEKILQSKSHMEDPNSKKTTKEPFSGYKSNVDSSRKLDKLIIKTDFLKNKHLLKMKKKYKERKTSHFEEGAAQSVEKSKNAEVGESVKILNMDRVNGSKANNEKCKPPAATEQQLERAMNRLKSSSSLDKSHSRTQDRSPGKRRGRVKSQPESHFEKVKKVPTVQEYLERKRELCNQRSVPTVDQSDDATEGRHRVVERDSMERSGNLLPKLLPLTAAKMNVKTKNIAPEAIKHTRKGRPRVNGEYESLDKKYRGSTSGHGKGWLVSKGLDQKSTFHKEKIYLSPCDSSRRSSCDGISLTKLQIRCSPEKPGYYERRKSLDSSVHSKLSKSETKNEDAPKMLEFKLCPEFVHRSPSKQEKNGEPKAAKEKTVIEGIKSKKEAWCTGGPIKKSRMDSISEDQGCRSPSLSTSSFKSTQINSPRPLQDSQTTFNVFKQMYHEQRSKSLDASL